MQKRFLIGLIPLLGIPAAISLVNCGKDPGSVFDTDACQTFFNGKCGTACTNDQACGAGLHCQQGGCAASCVPSEKCDNGFTCTPKGRCQASDDDVLKDDPDSDGGVCADVSLNLEKVVPTVLLLVDQSGSMDAQLDGSKNRWQVVYDVLMDPAGGVVKQLEKDVEFGFARYHGTSATECPILNDVTNATSAVVQPALNNFTAINAKYPGNLPNGSNNTPTAESFRLLTGIDAAGGKVAGGFAASTTKGPKIVILATDGNPDTCGPNTQGVDEDGKTRTISGPDSNSSLIPQTKVADALYAGFKNDIRTYVIAVSNEVSVAAKTKFANAGAGKPPPYAGTEKYYDANSKADLLTAFNQIIFPFRSCTFKLNGTVGAGKESKGKVSLNGAPLTYQDANGWKLNSPTELEVTGTACDAVKAGTGTLQVSFPCDAVTIIN